MADLANDLIGRGYPSEWFWFLVAVSNVLSNGVGQGRDAGKGAAANAPLSDFREKAFD
jgi:hypothetical protein